ncbi:MAG: sodium/solute symporter [Hyphomicrobiaceae bacterium]|nr:sodium/solute symporter [Hyphomicrobiaceae bacterium]MCC0008386.1 sodium/solute symporter [Hyphomicrobiaceae bacterium]
MAALDWAVIAVYGLVVLALGWRAGGKGSSSSEDDYFLAGRREGWAPVAASTWATKLSALTFIGVPGAAMAGNFAYMQLWIGSFLAAYVVARALIPEFYAARVATVYEYLERRIGRSARLSGTLIFIVSRCLASAVRLAGCAIAISVFFDLGMATSVVMMAGVAALYVLTGGLRAVIWTDVLQLALFLTGAAAALVYIVMALPGGLGEMVSTAAAADKLRVLDLRFDAADPTTFWMGNLFAFVLGIATGGADQDIAQRALACPDARRARIAVMAAGAADLFSTALFLSVGAALFAFYAAFPQDAVASLVADGRHDYVFPHFIRHELPAGLRGMLVAALLAAAMSSLDSALSGLASSAYYDLGLTRRSDRRLEADGALVGPRLLVVVFSVVLAVIAIGFGAQPSILWFGLQVMGYTYGALLGLFLLALLAPRQVDDIGCAVAALTSIGAVVLLTQSGLGFGLEPVPWPWAVIIGTAWTVLVAFAISGARRHLLRVGAR